MAVRTLRRRRDVGRRRPSSSPRLQSPSLAPIKAPRRSATSPSTRLRRPIFLKAGCRHEAWRFKSEAIGQPIVAPDHSIHRISPEWNLRQAVLLPVRRWSAFDAAKFYTMASQIPVLPGAYLLLIELTKASDVKLSNVWSASLVPGRYFYASSAYGPEGSKPESLDICDELKCNDGM